MSAQREINRRQSASGRGERRTRTKLKPLGYAAISASSDAIAESSRGPVLVIVPSLNEEEYIEDVVTKLAAEAERIDLKVIVADGGSIDRTRSIVQRLSDLNPRIVLIDNSKRIQAAAVNSAVRKYGETAKFLIRVDAHASYPDRYCETLLNVQARTLADSVVVTMRTVGQTCFQRAAAAAQNSVLGNGGSAHRNETSDRWVDHGHHALMTINAFTAVEGYDETFSHNEDAELDVRLIENGFRIYLTSEVQVTYYPRGSVIGLFKQYFNIGRGRARNFLKHRKNTKLRHLILVAVAPAICLVMLSPFAGLCAVPALSWALLCIGCGVVLGVRGKDGCATAAGLAAIAMQAGWSFGFFRGLVPDAGWNGAGTKADASQDTETS
jgi:succinoglycan biosynthesis protein ExoA